MALYGCTLRDFNNLVIDDLSIWKNPKQHFGILAFMKAYITIPGFKIMFWKRLSLYLNIENRKTPLSILVHNRYRRIGRKFGIEIPYFLDVGGGVKIDHTYGIVINGFSKIGNNLIIKQNSTIGHRGGGYSNYR